MSDKTTPNKNVYQKLFAFRKSIIVDRKKVSDACDEQEVLITYEDDVKAVGNTVYFVSKVHFIDIVSGNEIVAQALAEKLPSDNSRRNTDQSPISRQWAYVALLGATKNMHSQEVPDVINQLNTNPNTTDGKAESKPASEQKATPAPAPASKAEKPAETKVEKPAETKAVAESKPAPVPEQTATPEQNTVPAIANAEPIQSGKPEAEPDGGGLPANFGGFGHWNRKK